jgi:hypothetical protein
LIAAPCSCKARSSWLLEPRLTASARFCAMLKTCLRACDDLSRPFDKAYEGTRTRSINSHVMMHGYQY